MSGNPIKQSPISICDLVKPQSLEEQSNRKVFREIAVGDRNNEFSAPFQYSCSFMDDRIYIWNMFQNRIADYGIERFTLKGKIITFRTDQSGKII